MWVLQLTTPAALSGHVLDASAALCLHSFMPHPLSCVELGDKNPLVQIHDQGAGGNCNVVKEIIYPLGAEIDVRAVKVR